MENWHTSDPITAARIILHALSPCWGGGGMQLVKAVALACAEHGGPSAAT